MGSVFKQCSLVGCRDPCVCWSRALVGNTHAEPTAAMAPSGQAVCPVADTERRYATRAEQPIAPIPANPDIKNLGLLHMYAEAHGGLCSGQMRGKPEAVCLPAGWVCARHALCEPLLTYRRVLIVF